MSVNRKVTVPVGISEVGTVLVSPVILLCRACGCYASPRHLALELVRFWCRRAGAGAGGRIRRATRVPAVDASVGASHARSRSDQRLALRPERHLHLRPAPRTR